MNVGKVDVDYGVYNESSGLQIDITQLASGFIQFANFTRAEIEEHLSTACVELEDYMKHNHPWQNRTGEAERGLSANFFEDNLTGKDWIPVTMGITLEHGVYYGEYLELAMETRYAILEPTARLKGPEVFKSMQGLLDRLG